VPTCSEALTLATNNRAARLASLSLQSFDLPNCVRLGGIDREWPRSSDQAWGSFLWACFTSLREWVVREFDRTDCIHPIKTRA